MGSSFKPMRPRAASAMAKRVRIFATRLTALVSLASFWIHADAQVATVRADESGRFAPRAVALTNARLVIEPGQVVDHGTLLMRNGVIEAAGAGIAVPAGARVLDMQGRTVLAGFIDARGQDAVSDIPVVPAQADPRQRNALLAPDRDMAAGRGLDPQRAGKLRAIGFTSALSTPGHGALRGRAALYATRNVSRPSQALLAQHVAQVGAFAFNLGEDRYPTSAMGSVALVRQALHDAKWYRQYTQWQQRHPSAERAEPDPGLEALAPVVEGRQPLLLEVRHALDPARGQGLAAEFGLRLIVAGDGAEYRWLRRSDPGDIALILPLAFPEPPNVDDPDAALDLSLAQLEHWAWAPFNPRIAAEAGVRFALTPAGLREPEKAFWSNLRKAVRSGLAEDAALAALTLEPARMLGVDDRLGSLRPGRLAHLLVADADLLRSDRARIHAVWIDGEEYPLARPDDAEALTGRWHLEWTGAQGPAAMEVEASAAGTALAVGWRFPLTQSGSSLSLHLPGAALALAEEQVTLVAEWQGDMFDGHLLRDGRDAIRVRGRRQAVADASPVPIAAMEKPALPGVLRYPAGEYGRVSPPPPHSLLIRNATVWTQGPQGRLDDADLLVQDGRIRAVGRGLAAPASVEVFDGRGLHITPGLVDAHSHVALAGGLNEMSYAVTSEVRIADALDPSDIGLYRQVSAGVTTAHLLHGSVNPIGGQSQVIKLRWGHDATGLHFAQAPPAIKFAMGENVKQTHWGLLLDFTPRYPQTRMGVQALYRDWLDATRRYMQRTGGVGEPLRRDLRLEPLAEVLSQKRKVHIHGYRQDEILGFARLSRQFGFKPVFTHALEAYKIAPELGELQAEVSTFSDWWGFKMEMADAIPYNAGVLAEHGVLVSLKSDDAELARRLNIEAAKAVKYSGFEESQALALVTINPARQLGVADRVGSLEPGKDADFVVWNAHPLSVAAAPQQTWIEGRKYFDAEEDRSERQRVARAREQLMRQALQARVKAPQQASATRAGGGR